MANDMQTAEKGGAEEERIICVLISVLVLRLFFLVVFFFFYCFYALKLWVPMSVIGLEKIWSSCLQRHSRRRQETTTAIR